MNSMTSHCRYPARVILAGLCVLLTAGSGCSVKEEKYHFAAVDVSDAVPRLRFYRFNVRATSSLCTSSYQAGFYDADALHNLFGEVTDTKDKTSGSSTFILQWNKKASRWETVDRDKRFTILYGANADAMADQISAFANNDEAGKQVASLLAAVAVRGPDYQEALLKRWAASKAKAEAAALSKALTTAAGKLDKPEDANATDVEGVLEEAARAATRAQAAVGAVPAEE